MKQLFTKEFLSETPLGAVQVIHGMREHSGRYTDFANFLKEHGYSVFLSDHPFHGSSTMEGINIQADKDFFKTAVDEQLNYSKNIKSRFPDLPLFVLGHSMGSFILQKYMQLQNPASGYILSGSCGKREISKIGYHLTKFYLNFFKDSYSKKFEELVFWGFNKKEKNDWLTANSNIYSKVEEDPLWKICYPISFYNQFFKFLTDIYNSSDLNKIDKDRPIYIFSGKHDPVGLNGRGVKALFEQYKRLKCTSIKMKIYPEGRHEMLNELNREEVFEDILNWLNNERSNLKF